MQTSEKRRWLSVQEKSSVVLARVYREDSRAEEDFSLICRREAARQVEHDALDGKEALRNEYLISTLEIDGHDSLAEPRQQIGEDGAMRRVDEPRHFVVLDTAHGNRRPKVMPTAESPDALAARAALALQVMHQERFEPADAAAEVVPNVHHVYKSGDQEWVRPQDLAGKHASWYQRLYKWTPGPSTHHGCISVSKPVLVENRVPLMDANCPTAVLCWSLKKKGWTAVDHKCDHVTAAITDFDAYEAVKMKTYYQALRMLPTCLGLTTHLPSRQPIRYYQLLMAGEKVEPGLGAAHYLTLFKNASKAGKVIEPLADGEDDDPCALQPPEDEDDDDIAVPFMPAEPARKRRKVPKPPVGSGAGGGGSGGGASGSGGADPPPVICDPPPTGTPPPSPESDVGVGGPEPPPLDLGGPPPDEDPDNDDVVVPLGPGPARAPRVGPPKFFEGMDGFQVRFDPHYMVPGSGVTFSPNWQLKCKIHGGKCIKTKRLTL